MVQHLYRRFLSRRPARRRKSRRRGRPGPARVPARRRQGHPRRIRDEKRRGPTPAAWKTASSGTALGGDRRRREKTRIERHRRGRVDDARTGGNERLADPGFGAGHRVARLWRERARQGFASDLQIVHRLGAGHRSGFPDHGPSPGVDRDGDHSGRPADVAGRRLCAEIHDQPRVDVRAGFRHRHIWSTTPSWWSKTFIGAGSKPAKPATRSRSRRSTKSATPPSSRLSPSSRRCCRWASSAT